MLQSESYQLPQSGDLDDFAAYEIHGCEPPAQVARALVDIRAAEDDLRTGNIAAFDVNIAALRQRTRDALSCAPHQSYFWLLSFWTTTLQAGVTPQAIRMLEMSYQTAPFEAWIAVRRASVAVNIIPLASDSLRESILIEFRNLVRDGLLREAVTAYAVSRDPVRQLLTERIEQLPGPRQSEFWATLGERTQEPES